MPETSDAASGPARFRVRPLFLLPVLLFLGLAALFAARLGAGDPSRVPSALLGRTMPAVALPALAEVPDGKGEPLPGLDTRSPPGRVTLVNVWASWCAPCRIEHPHLMDLARDPALRIVGINYKDKPEAARRFLGQLGNPYAAIGVDESGRAAIEWGVYGVPETFVVGPDGTIRHRHVGPLTPETLPGFLAKMRDAAR